MGNGDGSIHCKVMSKIDLVCGFCKKGRKLKTKVGMSFGSFFIFNAIIPPFDRAFRFRNEINLKLTEVQGDRNKIWKQE